MRWRRRRDSDQDARIAEAIAAVGDAGAEVERSRRRQEAARKHVVEPLREFAEHNQFSQMIEATLRGGYRGEPS